jgi:hypothetical protein
MPFRLVFSKSKAGNMICEVTIITGRVKSCQEASNFAAL